MTIREGDLVMLVRGHGCVIASIGGIPFRVTHLMPQLGGGWFCPKCDTSGLAPLDKFAAAGCFPSSPDVGVPLSWLIKINPDTEPEHIERDEEITA